MSQRRTAVSYSRFSDPKQAAGDSEGRQADLFRDFCLRHNLTPGPEVYADRGKSGYRDEHRKKGRLGQLIAAAKDGRFDPGTVIVVEAWDRLGRLRPDKQTALVAELLQTGVAVGVCRLNDVFSEDDFGSHKWTVLSTFIMLAYQESKQKADRVAATWRRRRENARENGGLKNKDGKASGKLPGWLEVVNGEVRLVPERAAAVRRIFQLAAEGFGRARIIARLQADGVRPFGDATVRKGRSRPLFCGKWSSPYIRLILTDRRAVGEIQYRTADGKPDGPALKTLPAAVTEEAYQLARSALEKRDKGRGKGPRDRRHVNVFRGLLRHARDDEGMVLRNQGTEGKPRLLLQNGSGAGGRGRYYTFPYPAFEDAVLGQLKEIDGADVLPGAKESPGKAAVLRAALKNVRGDLEALQRDLKAGYSKTLAAVVREKEAEEERLAGELQDELARSAVPAEKAWREFRSLADVIKGADDPDAVRLKVRTLLRSAVESIWVLIVPKGATRLCAVQVCFAGGARRHYLIAHRTAAYRRREEWRPWSFGEAAPGEWDLSDRGDAALLAKKLAESLE
jgi:DNA invertase Pin-like site-specific DNA recombinase